MDNVPPKPTTLPVQLDTIPPELKTLPRWVGWRWAYNANKPSGHHQGWDKPPLNSSTGTLAASDNPDTWGTYQQAVDFMRRESLDGIGYNLLGLEGVVVHDLDSCRDLETGEITPQAMSIVRLVGSYWEVTPSGTGIRGIAYGKKNGTRVEASKGGPLDGAQYDGSRGRYITLTGHTLPESTQDITDAHPGGIEAAYSLIFPARERKTGPPPNPDPVDLDDDDLLQKARAARNGDKFSRLWAGDTSGHGGDDSVADMALCGCLAFWTGPDAAHIDRLFRRSGLMRPKWDERRGDSTYGSITISKVLAEATEFYRPGGYRGNGRSQEGIPEDQVIGPEGPTTEKEFPTLPEEVWVGWLERFRDWVLPTTDGGLEGIFGSGSLALGLAIGRNLNLFYGVDTYANLYINLIGPTGVPRKSTLFSRARSLFNYAFDHDFLRTAKSIGSAEGLLELFCHEIEDGTGKDKRTKLEPIPGQRVLLNEAEFTNLLKKIRRPGTANIAEILLTLFDGEDYAPNTRRRPIRVQDPFFSLLTTTTPESLETTLQDVDIDSGLVPRFANFFCTPRTPKAYPDKPKEDLRSLLAAGLQDITAYAVELGQHTPTLALSPVARTEWEGIYTYLTETSRKAPKAVAGILVRVPTMIMKWAFIYAIQASHTAVEIDDLMRAVMVGEYLQATAWMVPKHVAKTQLSKFEQKLLEIMAENPDFWWKTSAIHQRISGRVDATGLRRSLDSLEALGRLEKETQGTRFVYRIIQ